VHQGGKKDLLHICRPTAYTHTHICT